VPAAHYGQQPAQAVPQFVPPPGSQPIAGTVPPPPPRPTSPYDFFMEQKQAAKKAKSLPGGNYVWIIGGSVLVILILTAVALSRPQAPPKVAMAQVASAQTETLRICDAGIEKVKSQTLKNFTSACALSMSTQRNRLTSLLAKSGVKLSDGTLGRSRNVNADKKLAAAGATSSYDEAYREVATTQLDAQSRSLKIAAADALVTAEEQKLINEFTDQTTLLRQQLDQ
jgi:hypothetical protein